MTAARLTWRFALLPALAVVALTVVMLACGHRLLADELTRRALASNQQRADLLGLQLQLSLRDAVTQVKLLARSPLMQAGAPAPRQRAELDHVVQGSPRFVWIGLAAPDGQVRAASRGWLEGQSIAQRPVFELGRQGMVGDMHEAVTLAPLLAQLRGGASELIDIGEPVRDEAGAVTGVLAAHLGLHWVREQLQLSLGRPEQAEAAGLRGLVLTGPRSVVAGAAVPRGLPADIGQARVWQGEDGRRWLLAQAVLQAGPGDTALLPWRVVVLQSEDAALAPLLALDSTMLAIGVVAALLLAAAGAWASRRLLTPWDPVFDAVLGGQPADADRIAARVQALVAARPQPTPAERLMGWLARDAGNLRRALDHLPVAVALADRHYRCEYVNPAYTRLLGWTTEAALGRPVGEALVDAAEREALARLHQQLGDAPGEFVSRLEARTPSGATVAVQCHLVPMFDAQGRLMGALCIVHDIRAERSARAQAHALHGRLQALADAAVDTLFATLDVDGRVLEWSRGAAGVRPSAQRPCERRRAGPHAGGAAGRRRLAGLAALRPRRRPLRGARRALRRRRLRPRPGAGAGPLRPRAARRARAGRRAGRLQPPAARPGKAQQPPARAVPARRGRPDAGRAAPALGGGARRRPGPARAHGRAHRPARHAGQPPAARRAGRTAPAAAGRARPRRRHRQRDPAAPRRRARSAPRASGRRRGPAAALAGGHRVRRLHDRPRGPAGRAAPRAGPGARAAGRRRAAPRAGGGGRRRRPGARPAVPRRPARAGAGHRRAAAR
jgi:PAS domain S-box-containing protein